MIKVLVEKDKIIIKGHAGYNDFGKDIVCSAVSSIVTTSINSILALKNDGIKFSDKSGEVIISDIKDYKEVDVLLKVMLNLLSDLSKNYPDNIKISKED